MATLRNNSETRPGEVIFGPNGVINNSTSGIKGFYATATFATDNVTDVGVAKVLFSVWAKFDSSNKSQNKKGIYKCNNPNCKICKLYLIECKSFKTANGTMSGVPT